MQGVSNGRDAVGTAGSVRLRTFDAMRLVWKITEGYAERTNTETMILTTIKAKRNAATARNRKKSSLPRMAA